MGTEIYNDLEYFTNRPGSIEQLPWESGQLRYGDMCCAVGYALGMESFEEVREILGFRDEGKENYPLLGAKRQIEMLWEKRKRTPFYVADIGGGRGEISIGLSHFGITTQLLEPSISVYELVEKTGSIFNIPERPLILNAKFGQLIPIGPNQKTLLDTVIFCESIEHIPREEFDGTFTKVIKPLLQYTHGLLIIVNWLTPWPIEIEPPWHVRLCNDEFYDWLVRGGETVYRNKSHLVVRY